MDDPPFQTACSSTLCHALLSTPLRFHRPATPSGCSNRQHGQISDEKQLQLGTDGQIYRSTSNICVFAVREGPMCNNNW